MVKADEKATTTKQLTLRGSMGAPRLVRKLQTTEGVSYKSRESKLGKVG